MATTNFRLIILHCGTNDVHSKTVEEILDLISETIIAIRQKNFVCKIAVSAIIQRQCDDEGQRLQILKKKFQKFCYSNHFEFLRPYRIFLHDPKQFYARDGLHLN